MMNYRQGLGSSVSVEVLDTNLKVTEHIENHSKKSEKAIEIKKKKQIFGFGTKLCFSSAT